MKNIKNVFTFLNNFILPMQLIATVVLIYQFYTFQQPTTKFETTEKPVEMSVKTPNLGTKGSFIYFDGKFEGAQKKMTNHYEYDPKYPDEIFDGYIILAKNNNGNEYWIWSRKDNLDLSDREIKGWFFTDNLANFENKKNQYLQILYPVVEKRSDNLNIN